eukprot:12643473-Alexandrium_andersonii.AAC.1
MLRDWWKLWRKGRELDVGPHAELLALARGARHPLSPALARWLRQHGWQGGELSTAAAGERATLSSNERAAQRRLAVRS